MSELKRKRLPTFGTAHERKERLRKHHGVGGQVASAAVNPSQQYSAAGFQS